MDAIRQWLLANGFTPEELDDVAPATIKLDVDNLGVAFVAALIEIEQLKARIAALEEGAGS